MIGFMLQKDHFDQQCPGGGRVVAGSSGGKILQ